MLGICTFIIYLQVKPLIAPLFLFWWFSLVWTCRFSMTLYKNYVSRLTSSFSIFNVQRLQLTNPRRTQSRRYKIKPFRIEGEKPPGPICTQPRCRLDIDLPVRRVAIGPLFSVNWRFPVHTQTLKHHGYICVQINTFIWIAGRLVVSRNMYVLHTFSKLLQDDFSTLYLLLRFYFKCHIQIPRGLVGECYTIGNCRLKCYMYCFFGHLLVEWNNINKQCYLACATITV